MAAYGKITLRNYRCFGWNNPAILEFGDGFTAYVGPNNVGKSSAIRAIFELRGILGNVISTLVNNNGNRSSEQPAGVSDIAEVVNDKNPEKFEIKIEIEPPIRVGSTSYAVEITIEFEYTTRTFNAIGFQFINSSGQIVVVASTQMSAISLVNAGSHVVAYQGTQIDCSSLYFFASDLAKSKYFPAFRNAINEGGGQYYDLAVGTALVQTWDSWKAGTNRAQKVAIGKVEKQIADLLGFGSLQINADQTGKTLDVIIDQLRTTLK
ncbi:AAA domain-containing protein [Collimonas sp. OK607]|uniref:AAA family ATPase n=1 Tax=Collimonas sp. OK607 TaxID=1798194 RepID=UPI0008E154F8|nr:AAA family ATPase [Collimonas sp. OK607]SFB04121.1 AAA domain-containing protein [Collimonas sp. OK607]